MEEIKKSNRGRKSKFATLKMDQIKQLILAGWTDVRICQFFGIQISTLKTYKQKYPEFKALLKDWKIEADTHVEKSLYERALGYSHPEEVIFQFQGNIIRAETVKHYPPDPTSMIFWLKNRQPDKWRDHVEPKEDDTTKGQELEFVDIPSNGGGRERFKQYIEN